jgi:hypothetical protein
MRSKAFHPIALSRRIRISRLFPLSGRPLVPRGSGGHPKTAAGVFSCRTERIYVQAPSQYWQAI